MKQFFKGMKKGSESFTQCITTLINSTLLSVVYIFGVGATSIIARIAGKKFLETDKKKTYWSKKQYKTDHYRQF